MSEGDEWINGSASDAESLQSEDFHKLPKFPPEEESASQPTDGSTSRSSGINGDWRTTSDSSSSQPTDADGSTSRSNISSSSQPTDGSTSRSSGITSGSNPIGSNNPISFWTDVPIKT